MTESEYKEGIRYLTEKLEICKDEINRLQARVEKCEKVEHFADKTIATLQAENTELLGKIEQLEANRVELLENIEQLEDMVTQNEGVLPKYENYIKAEAYKECIDMVKKKGINIGVGEIFITTNTLDNLLKEMVNKEN